MNIAISPNLPRVPIDGTRDPIRNPRRGDAVVADASWRPLPSYIRNYLLFCRLHQAARDAPRARKASKSGPA